MLRSVSEINITKITLTKTWALFYFIKDINNKTTIKAAKPLESGLIPWSRDLIIVINIINYLFILPHHGFVGNK